ncbi:MAG: hypothetical protein GY866_20495, partial [Proteobacteria bacterium]|nr:hypothetical protein [Pseudomonadota bacterium]
MSNVVYYDGSRFLEAASGFGYANGINVAPGGNTLYLATTIQRSLLVFDRDPASGKLGLRETLFLETGLDNIEIDGQGDLWIGAHPQLLKFVGHAADKAKMAPSQVLRLRRIQEDAFQVDEIYLNRGDQLSASSVAAVRNGRMLIGAVLDPGFLDCRMK